MSYRPAISEPRYGSVNPKWMNASLVLLFNEYAARASQVPEDAATAYT